MATLDAVGPGLPGGGLSLRSAGVRRRARRSLGARGGRVLARDRVSRPPDAGARAVGIRLGRRGRRLDERSPRVAGGRPGRRRVRWGVDLGGAAGGPAAGRHIPGGLRDGPAGLGGGAARRAGPRAGRADCGGADARDGVAGRRLGGSAASAVRARSARGAVAGPGVRRPDARGRRRPRAPAPHRHPAPAERQRAPRRLPGGGGQSARARPSLAPGPVASGSPRAVVAGAGRGRRGLRLRHVRGLARLGPSSQLDAGRSADRPGLGARGPTLEPAGRRCRLRRARRPRRGPDALVRAVVRRGDRPRRHHAAHRALPAARRAALAHVAGAERGRHDRRVAGDPADVRVDLSGVPRRRAPREPGRGAARELRRAPGECPGCRGLAPPDGGRRHRLGPRPGLARADRGADLDARRRGAGGAGGGAGPAGARASSLGGRAARAGAGAGAPGASGDVPGGRAGGRRAGRGPPPGPGRRGAAGRPGPAVPASTWDPAARRGGRLAPAPRPLRRAAPRPGAPRRHRRAGLAPPARERGRVRRAVVPVRAPRRPAAGARAPHARGVGGAPSLARLPRRAPGRRQRDLAGDAAPRAGSDGPVHRGRRGRRRGGARRRRPRRRAEGGPPRLEDVQRGGPDRRARPAGGRHPGRSGEPVRAPARPDPVRAPRPSRLPDGPRRHRPDRAHRRRAARPHLAPGGRVVGLVQSPNTSRAPASKPACQASQCCSSGQASSR